MRLSSTFLAALMVPLAVSTVGCADGESSPGSDVTAIGQQLATLEQQIDGQRGERRRGLCIDYAAICERGTALCVPTPPPGKGRTCRTISDNCQRVLNDVCTGVQPPPPYDGGTPDDGGPICPWDDPCCGPFPQEGCWSDAGVSDGGTHSDGGHTCDSDDPCCETDPSDGCWSDAGVPHRCEPFDAEGVGYCKRAAFGFKWNGYSCELVSGCLCEGDDCGRLYNDFEECRLAHRSCFRPPPNPCMDAPYDTHEGAYCYPGPDGSCVCELPQP